MNGDLSWAHAGGGDSEYDAFIANNASGDGELIFGRVTYDMMVAYWPTPAAMENMPVVAEGMNGKSKVVFSRTMNAATWNSTRLVKDDSAAEIRKMKGESGDSMVILGSGSIVSLLASENLIDEYHLVVVPVVLGKGRTMFEGLKAITFLKLTGTRTFNNGKVLLSYERET